jgi:hypothetical protein
MPKKENMEEYEDEIEDFDMDVRNYTVPELIEAIGLSGTPSRQEVDRAVQLLVNQNARADATLAQFYMDAGAAIVRNSRGPNKETPVSRVLMLDSFYRESLLDEPDSYTCTLSEKLVGVTSLSLLSIELPQSWYQFTNAKGTNAFVFQSLDVDLAVYTKEVTIPEGNYTNVSLLAVVNAALNDAVRGMQYYANGSLGTGPWLALTQDPVNGRATLFSNSFPHTVKLTWYDPAYVALSNTTSNFNLGWLLGFRYVSTSVEPNANIAADSLVMDGSCTRYVVLKIDDHTSSRMANNIISIQSLPDQQINLPSYSANAFLTRNSSTNQVTALPTAPRRLTNAQLITISSISSAPLSQRSRTGGADTTNFFAKVPIKHQADWTTYSNGATVLKENGPAKILIEMGGTLQKNKRVYYGPVTLNKFSVSLWDDHGKPLGLNGQDWSCSLEATFG